MTDLSLTVRMKDTEISGCNFDSGLNALICQDNLQDEEHPSYSHSHQDRQQEFKSSMPPWRHYSPAAVSLALLAAVLLIVDISLGVHYNNLKDTHLTPEDTERITSELTKLQESYKTAIETTKDAQKKLDIEMRSQTPTNWELEHQTKRGTNYNEQIEKMEKDIEALRLHLPMINDGCTHCLPGWILMNSVCYYFSFSDGPKSWQKARNFCQLHGGDLAFIDSKEKEKSIVDLLIRDHNKEPSQEIMGFWIGLRDVHEEGTWKWADGTLLVEGYWNDGEPNNINDEDCAAVYARENYFMAWNDVRCRATLKWICEKTLTSLS